MKINLLITGLILCLGFAISSIASNTGKEVKHFTDTKTIPEINDKHKVAVPIAHEVPVTSTYRFVKKDENKIVDNDSTMLAFFEALYTLKAESTDTTEVLSVVHIGDSHIQAGYLTGRVMRNFQHEFGNAGRGLVVPLKLARTNEPNDYFITSTNQWKGGRLIQKNRTLPVGVGGIGVETQSKAVNFTLRLGEKNGSGYEFNQITVFSDEKAPVLDSDVAIDSVSSVTTDYSFAYKLRLDTLTDSIRLKGSCNTTSSNPLYYGFSLENGSSGVLYHSIGINGAHYADYVNSYAFKQTQVLAPKLIIISLGTNEAFGRNLKETVLKYQIDETIAKIKQENPNSLLLITTPPECYVKKRVNKKVIYEPNAKVAKVRDVLIDYAKEKGIAYWDLYEVTGGKGSCKNWYSSKLMSRDHIHFTQDGYQLQGDLLYNALISGYNEYVANRNRLQ